MNGSTRHPFCLHCGHLTEKVTVEQGSGIGCDLWIHTGSGILSCDRSNPATLCAVPAYMTWEELRGTFAFTPEEEAEIALEAQKLVDLCKKDT